MKLAGSDWPGGGGPGEVHESGKHRFGSAFVWDSRATFGATIEWVSSCVKNSPGVCARRRTREADGIARWVRQHVRKPSRASGSVHRKVLVHRQRRAKGPLGLPKWRGGEEIMLCQRRPNLGERQGPANSQATKLEWRVGPQGKGFAEERAAEPQ